MNMQFDKTKSDPRCSDLVMTAAYQLLPAMLMYLSPLAVSGVLRQDLGQWQAFAEHFGYAVEWNPLYERAGIVPDAYDDGLIRLHYVSSV